MRNKDFETAISGGAHWTVTSERPSAPLAGPIKNRDSSVVLVFDGGSKGNPGLGYGSFTYKGPIVRWQTRIEYPGKTTNNQAEYMTMIAGIRAIIFDCQALDVLPETVRVDIWSDSQLVVNQMNGDWKVKNAGMRTLHAEASDLLSNFADWRIAWHRRAESVRILGH